MKSSYVGMNKDNPGYVGVRTIRPGVCGGNVAFLTFIEGKYFSRQDPAENLLPSFFAIAAINNKEFSSNKFPILLTHY